jgi:two-component system CheB/CheR fusion protein
MTKETYITGRTGKYLEPVAGKANWNIHAMARDGLRKELPNAFQRALRSDEPIELRNKIEIITEILIMRR